MKKLAEWMGWTPSDNGPTPRYCGRGEGHEKWMTRSADLTPAGAVAVLEKVREEGIHDNIRLTERFLTEDIMEAFLYDPDECDFCTIVRDAALAYLESIE